MKEYPSISRVTQFGKPVYVFDKLDGSNLRAEWDRKKGWWKFGKRHGLVDHTLPILLKGEPLFMEKYSEDLSRILHNMRVPKATAFFEFWGPNSFAGTHDEDDDHTVTLIDFSVHKKGFLHPRDFLKILDGVDHASLLYHGNFTKPLRNEIMEGLLPGITSEGVVCKGSFVSPGRPLMFKVKTKEWLDNLRNFCGDNETLFNKMM